MPMALEGLRVLEVSRVAVGGFCTMMLADMGANVIKVEAPPEQGGGLLSDPENLRMRRLAVDRNKQSILLNMKHSQGQEIFQKLATTADVLIEGFRPGVMGRLGAGYDALRKLNPRLIYCSLSGYGQTGPLRLAPGHDANFIALAGALSMIGEQGGKPVIPVNFLADYASAALHATIGILMAIIARGKTGEGQHIDVAYADGVIAMMGALPATWEYLAKGRIIERGTTMVVGAYAYNGVYQTKDGHYVTLGCVEHHLWENFCKTVGREDLISYKHHPRHTTEPPTERERWAKSEAEALFRTRTRAEWEALLKDKDVCFAPVLNVGEALAHPQFTARGLVVEVQDREGRSAKVIGPAIKYSATPAVVRTPAPAVGEQTREIALSLGYTAQQYDQMASRGVFW